MNLGELIRKTRMDAGMQIKDLAFMLGVTPDTVINWELRGMKPMKRILLSILLLMSLASASHIWGFSTDGEVSTKPVIYQASVVVASDDGNIYSRNPMTGGKQWQLEVGQKPNEVFVFDNAIITSITSGKITKIKC